MSRTSPRTAAVAVIALLVAAPPAAAAPFDKVLLKDGRMIEGTLVEADDPGQVVIELRGVRVPVRTDLIRETYVENLENYVPKSKKEEEHLAKGLVLFEGTWMSRTRREQELARRAAEQDAKIERLRKEQDWRNAKTVETRHFVVKSNMPAELLDTYVERLEQYYKHFTDHWGIKLRPGDVDGKMEVFLYRTKPDFHKVTGVPYYVGGFFNFVDGELHLYHNYEDPDESLDTLFHEGNHLLTHFIDTKFRYPIWLNEGMAEYYGTAEIDERGDFHTGGLQYGRIVSMKNDRDSGKFMRLREVLLTDRGTFDARHYAMAWSFVHFLMESPEYGKRFRGFFANLPENRDIDISHKAYSNIKGTQAEVELDDVAAALEKRLGKSIEDLEAEWLEWIEQSYGELTPNAYYLAARLALRRDEKDGSHIDEAFELFQKAVDMGIQNASCYRAYAELLRKGGVLEGSLARVTRQPDPELAWEMIQKAIELDPLGALHYCEAAGILILPGKVQDLDRAAAMVDIARALAPDNYVIRSLTDELMSLIEPAREKRRLSAEAAAADQRIWHVQPFYTQGEEAPAVIEGLSTSDLLERIRGQTVGPKDWVFQVWRPSDPATGELLEGTEPWEKEWVPLKDVPEFAEVLEEVAAADTAEDEA